MRVHAVAWASVAAVLSSPALPARAQATSAPDEPSSIREQIRTLESESLETLLQTPVVTATRTAQPLADAPASLRVVTGAEIRDRGYSDLEQVLHDLPGFDFNRGFGIEYSTIFMRGFRSDNSDRFLLLYDNILENHIWKQNALIDKQYALSNIKRIEVLYGPASALYGTNAFSGIINVITKEGGELGAAHVSVGAGAYGQRSFELSSGHDFGANELFGYDFTARLFSADDLHPWSDARHPGRDFMHLDPNSAFSAQYQQQLGHPQIVDVLGNEVVTSAGDGSYPMQDYSFHANLYVRPRGFGRLKLTYFDWVAHDNEGYWYNPFKRGNLSIQSQWYQHNNAMRLEHAIKLGPESAGISNTFAVTGRIHRYTPSADVNGGGFLHKPDAQNPGINALDPWSYKLNVNSYTMQNGQKALGYAELDWYGLRVWDVTGEDQATWSPLRELALTLGARFAHTDTQEDYYYLPGGASSWLGHAAADDAVCHAAGGTCGHRHERNTEGVFGQVQWSPVGTGLIVYGGGRFENQRDPTGAGYSIFVPRLAAVAHPTQGSTVRLSYSEAFQEADDAHRYSTDPGLRDDPNPSLRPERLRSFELGGGFLLGPTVWVDASGYMNFVSDQIGGRTQQAGEAHPGDTIYDNLPGTTRIFGFETGVTIKPNERTSLFINFSGARNESQVAGGRYRLFGDIAPFKMKAGGTIHPWSEAFAFSPDLQVVSARRTINWDRDPTVSPIVPTVAPYAIAGFYAAWTPVQAPHRFEVGVRVENAFDQAYNDPGVRAADGVKVNAQVLQPGRFAFLSVKGDW